MSVVSRPIPVGVVGVGSLGRHHARLYAELPDACLVAVVDTDFERAERIAAKYGCVAFRDPAELRGRVLAASVAVPTEYHRSIAEPLMQAGVDVLVEKPLASTVEDARSLNSVAARHSRRLMVGHSERFNPAIVALASEVLRPRFFEIHRLAGFTARSTDIDVVLDLMIHDLDLLLHLDGGEPIAVEAVGVSALTDKMDIANARIRMESGCVANITASRISAEPVRRVRVFQADSYLSCDTGNGLLDRYRLVRRDGNPTIEHDRLAVGESEPLRLELAAFLEAVATETPPPVDGLAGQRALELAYRVREAIDSV